MVVVLTRLNSLGLVHPLPRFQYVSRLIHHGCIIRFKFLSFLISYLFFAPFLYTPAIVTSMLALLLFGFIIGMAFSAIYKTYSEREMSWNIVLGMIVALQAKVLISLVLVDGLPIPTQIVLALWIFLVLSLKRLLTRPRDIKYLGS